MSKGDALELALLDHVLGGPDYTRPATVYFALYSAAPGDAGGGTELTSGTAPGYTRLAVTNNATNFPAAASGAKKLGVAQSFPANSGGSAWPQTAWWVLFDASTGGTLLLWGTMTPLACPPAQQITIPADTQVWTED